jgi:hypothetical protein
MNRRAHAFILGYHLSMFGVSSSCGHKEYQQKTRFLLVSGLDFNISMHKVVKLMPRNKDDFNSIRQCFNSRDGPLT